MSDEEEVTRPRGVNVYPMPDDVAGPFPCYALLVPWEWQPGHHEVRMVHTEGVSYMVRDGKPWVWNDYDPALPTWSVADLLGLVLRESIQPVDLADWVRVHNARLEDNFGQVYHWATERRQS